MPRCYAKPYKTETLPLLQNCDRPILLGSLHPTRVLTCVITTTCHYIIQVSELLPINPSFQSVLFHSGTLSTMTLCPLPVVTPLRLTYL